ncbi:high-affinity Zn(2+) transporter z.t1.c1 [Apiospora kogelbergensis]|uniref:High-affinity Zn(2+) transporter z.t1.c1 n=1 Tax=Apiospora kogelbergensis TaxID=1337665 RepID=A0AAW0R299_9PEZI
MLTADLLPPEDTARMSRTPTIPRTANASNGTTMFCRDGWRYSRFLVRVPLVSTFRRPGRLRTTPRSVLTCIPGVYGPILMRVRAPSTKHAVFIFVKQFGTGVVVSTAFVHLFTHANLMFENKCLGRINYEATPAAILLGGVIVSFMVDFLSHRLFSRRQQDDDERQISNDLVKIFALECGILFHSLLIGITLVVTGDSFFFTLALVISFHQLFEGIALGSRIAELGLARVQVIAARASSYGTMGEEGAEVPLVGIIQTSPGVSTEWKFVLASGFAFVTPLGMVVGMAVLHRFNGNDPSTIWVLGSLDAFSAGILVWTGVVEMWARDWLDGGEMAHENNVRTGVGLLGLLSGMALMGVLGKWA